LAEAIAPGTRKRSHDLAIKRNNMPRSMTRVLGASIGAIAICFGAILAAAVWTGGSTHGGATPSSHPAIHAVPCRTIVHGVVPGQASISVGWLPQGFHLTSGTPNAINGVTYSRRARGDGSRVTITLTDSHAPLTPTVGGMPTAAPVSVHGHPALLERPPAPPGVGSFINVYWKPRSQSLVSAVGYKLKVQMVLAIAGTVSTVPAGVVSLPMKPGGIVGRSTAIRHARAFIDFPHAHFRAKLSSLTEIQTVLQSTWYGYIAERAPASLKATPWRPVWAVLATKSHRPAMLVVIDGRSGAEEFLGGVGRAPSWFAALTERDPGLHAGCPGGSTARLPFGVPTRNEQAFTLRDRNAPNAQHLRTIVVMKLTTVRVLNRVDRPLYACIQDCKIDELVWPDIEETVAPAGSAFPCPAASSMGPGPAIRPKRSRAAFGISVVDNSESGCHALPKWVFRLKDLAPASSG
jgi:hypothetical protein